MNIIDIHTHAFPDNIAKRAIKKLEDMAEWKTVGDGTVDGLLRSMDESDIDISIVSPVVTIPTQEKGILEWARKIRSDRLEPFMSVHPENKKSTKWIKRFADEGIAGIKLHPMFQNFIADETRMDDIYGAAAENDLIVQIHCGRDIGYSADDDRADPVRIRNVIDRFNNLKLIAAHLGGFQRWDQVEKYLVGTNVYLDTSQCMKFLEPQRVKEIILAHGIEKVMFGTDWPWASPKEDLPRIEKLGLTEEEKKKILFANTAKLLGL